MLPSENSGAERTDRRIISQRDQLSTESYANITLPENHAIEELKARNPGRTNFSPSHTAPNIREGELPREPRTALRPGKRRTLDWRNGIQPEECRVSLRRNVRPAFSSTPLAN
jgi:hypothetical protein